MPFDCPSTAWISSASRYGLATTASTPLAAASAGSMSEAQPLTITTRNIWTNPKATFKDATPTGELPADYDPKQDKIERGSGDGRFGKWTKEVGEKLHVPVFDLTNYCADRYEKMGREQVNKLYLDHNHTHAAGAKIVAESIVSGLKALKNSPFTPLLSDAGKQLPTADAKYINDNPPDTH